MSILNKGGPLPDAYWVENPEVGNSSSEFCKMLQEIVKEKFFSYSYYKIEGEDVTSNTDSKPHYDDILYTFEEWKAALTSTGEKIQKATGQSSPVQDYSVKALMGKKIVVHCETEKEWEQCTSLIPKNRLSTDWKIASENSAFQVDQYGGSHSKVSYFRENGFQVITAQQFLAANTPIQSNVPVTEGNVYVGMKVIRSKKFLDRYTPNQLQSSPEDVGEIIKGGRPLDIAVKWSNGEENQYKYQDLYTAPGETNKVVINQSINNQPKTKQHDKEQQEHTGTAVLLSDHQSIKRGQTGTGTPVCLRGQPGLTKTGYKGNGKAVSSI